jgi:hypothetical protein
LRLVAGGWFVLREKYCWLVADKPSEQAASRDSNATKLRPGWRAHGGNGDEDEDKELHGRHCSLALRFFFFLATSS